MYVLGRIKDILIVQGRNVYPHDIEDCSRRVLQPEVAGDAAALGISEHGTESVVLIQEVRKGNRVQLLVLSRGEAGSNGTPDARESEARAAAKFSDTNWTTRARCNSAAVRIPTIFRRYSRCIRTS